MTAIVSASASLMRMFILSVVGIIVNTSLLVLPAASAASAASADPSDDYDESYNTCSLYLAPSSIPNAGLGIYTTVDVPQGAVVGEANDLFVHIIDKYKTLPYRGQQRFLPWLAYVWPESMDAFYPLKDENTAPEIPASFYRVDEGLSAAEGIRFDDGGSNHKIISAFAPGLASQVNSNPKLANLEFLADLQQTDWAGLDLEEDPGVGAFTPHHGVTFSATENIKAGSELFIDYGEVWHSRYYEKHEGSKKEYDTLENYREIVEKKHLPTGEEKRRTFLENRRTDIEELLETFDLGLKRPVFGKEKKRLLECKSDFGGYSLSQNVSKGHMEQGRDLRRQERKTSEKDERKDKKDEIKERDPIQPVEWLKQNGLCIDKIRAGRSTVPQAGRGAFAKTFISSGSIIAPAPLLALKRDDLNIYEIDETQEAYRDTLNLDEVMDQELLLNYCFGYEDSPLLLLPYAPFVNFINHNGDAPNAKIRWPDKFLLGDPNDWLDLHPIDVIEHSGKLMMEYVALRDILPGEEIFIDYGQEWENAWNKYTEDWELETESEEFDSFRHEIGVPSGFFPDPWNQSVVYELAPLETPLKPGELAEMKWAHNGKVIAKSGIWRIGLPPDFSVRLREYSDHLGITKLYEKLIYEDIIDDEEWFVFESHDEQWYVQRYASRDWSFNMHYISAWDEAARMSFLRALGTAGYDMVLEGMGNYFGLDNLVCFHNSFMGISEADNSVTHADVYATGEKGFNVFTSVLLVNGSKPELDIQGDDANVVLSVNYEYDVAYILGDWGYHKTSAIDYSDTGQMRMAISTYCAQIDETNARMMEFIYHDEETPATFIDQFKLPLKEIHWGNGHSLLSTTSCVQSADRREEDAAIGEIGEEL